MTARTNTQTQQLIADELRAAISSALKEHPQTLFFYPVPAIPAKGVRVELSSETAALLSKAITEVALRNGVEYSVESDVVSLDKEKAVVRITLRFATIKVQRVGEAALSSTSTATGELKPNDAAVRTAETRAFKRAMEALAGDTVFAWLRFAESFALTQLQTANAAAAQASKFEQVLVFSRFMQRTFADYVKQKQK
jgi:hypothetical protein